MGDVDSQQLQASERRPEIEADTDVDAVSPSPTDPALLASFEHCHEVTRRCARNFYYGLRLTPEPKRSAMYAVYAFMRACDDLADGVPASGGTGDAALERIERFRQTMSRAIDPAAPSDAARPLTDAGLPDGRMWPAFRDTVLRYGIDSQHFHAMLDGQRQDVLRSRYETFEDLFAYCQKVASSVGLVCLSVWGYDGEAQAKNLAEYRGVAFQLTNILRDVSEDAQRGRVYLPTAELRRFNYTADQLRQGVANPAFRRLMMFQIERAQNYYDMSAPLEPHIARECRATSWAMTSIYRGLLDRITRDPSRVLTRRVRLSSFQKMSIALRATWRHWRSR